MTERRIKSFAGVKELDGSTFSFTASVLEPDRDNELIPPKSLRIDQFLKNPIMDWGHSAVMGEGPDMSVVAKVVELEATDDRLEGIGEWWETNPFGALVADGYRKGFLNAFSITFLGNKWRDPNPDEMKRWPDQLGPRSVLEDGELVTISPVLVGSNRGAMYARGYGFLADLEDAKNMKDAFAKMDQRMREIEAVLNGEKQDNAGAFELDLGGLVRELDLTSKAIAALNSRR